jgi:hypothetical protein
MANPFMYWRATQSMADSILLVQKAIPGHRILNAEIERPEDDFLPLVRKQRWKNFQQYIATVHKAVGSDWFSRLTMPVMDALTLSLAYLDVIAKAKVTPRHYHWVDHHNGHGMCICPFCLVPIVEDIADEAGKNAPPYNYHGDNLRHE